MALTRLPGSKWWIETSDLISETVGVAPYHCKNTKFDFWR